MQLALLLFIIMVALSLLSVYFPLVAIVIVIFLVTRSNWITTHSVAQWQSYALACNIVVLYISLRTC